ncbi:ASCH domain-containing protein [Rhodophyticola sp. CCM32]|uniref:ASCH domain-containing protein n=1 Tax=Rhodophyticola sp. CCM32 TaxID=2916397 RepID=UPI00107F8B96|nr:ASCH domain-containing protein [Rhodophyticola sp. CCM32]QBX99507.1 ASCH domain-containing protein [Rhodophyticola sp. CCM32]
MSISVDDAKARYPGAETFTFGDSRALCDELLALVRAGVKTATCGALREFSPGGEPKPIPGQRDIALDWDGNPALVIESLAVSECRFCDVDAEFALAEGENESLAGWRAAHQAYFERNGGFEPEMMLVCERFRMIEDFGGGDV